MTIPYTSALASTSFFGYFKLLFRWRASIYKLMWKDFVLFCALYYAITMLYDYVLSPTDKRVFETIAMYCFNFSNLIPLSFVLGFYVTCVVSRFWEQFNVLPWPMQTALYVTLYIRGEDEGGRMMRRTIMRYLILAYVMTMASISPQIKKRFPTLNHLTEAGFLQPNEQLIIETMPTSTNKYFVPFVWATSIVDRARKEGKIKEDLAVQKLYSEINEFRGLCGSLFCYDWVTIPLVYTQVTTLAVYIFLIASLIGRRKLDNGFVGDFYFPFFTFLQFLFYMGWLKVAETLLNPFGEDDDDFEINYLIDRHLQEAYMVVDGMYEEVPELIKDQYWDKQAFDVPYTEAAQRFKKHSFMGSAAGVVVPENQQQFVQPDEPDVMSNEVGPTSSFFKRRKSLPRSSSSKTLKKAEPPSKEDSIVPGVDSEIARKSDITEHSVAPSERRESVTSEIIEEEVWITPVDRMYARRQSEDNRNGETESPESAALRDRLQSQLRELRENDTQSEGKSWFSVLK